MQKILFSIVALIAVAGFAGCKFANIGGIQGSGNSKTETRSLSGFKEIKVENALNVEVTAQKDFAFTITADDNLLEHIKTEVSGGTLVITTKDKISPRTKIEIRVSLPELTKLSVSGASTAVVAGAKTDALKLDASGASKIKIDGEVKSVEAGASGASGIDAENLKTENAKVNASGASNITVAPTGELDAEASGASTVLYTNEPKSIKQNASGASSIKKK